MKFELHLLAPVCDIGIVHPLHKYRPRMRMIRRRTLWFWIQDIIKFFGGGAVNKRAIDLDALDALLIVGWCHVRILALRR